MLDRDIALALALAKRPRLWSTAVGAAFAFAPSDWWRRAPFLPIPDADLLRWRVTTAYGDDETTIAPSDVVAYLEWRHRSAQGK
ncbi:MAG: hypothetical protein ABFS21_01065 [Actinomycetota bacterium]